MRSTVIITVINIMLVMEIEPLAIFILKGAELFNADNTKYRQK